MPWRLRPGWCRKRRQTWQRGPLASQKTLNSQSWVVVPSRDRRRVTHRSFASRNKQVLVYILPFQALTRPLNAAKIWTALFWAADSGLGLDLGLGLR